MWLIAGKTALRSTIGSFGSAELWANATPLGLEQPFKERKKKQLATATVLFYLSRHWKWCPARVTDVMAFLCLVEAREWSTTRRSTRSLKWLPPMGKSVSRVAEKIKKSNRNANMLLWHVASMHFSPALTTAPTFELTLKLLWKTNEAKWSRGE